MTFDSLAKGRRRQNGRLHFWPIDPFDRKESEIILRVEPCTLEALEGQIRPSGQRERIDCRLYMSAPLFPRVGLVVEDLQVPVADL